MKRVVPTFLEVTTNSAATKQKIFDRLVKYVFHWRLPKGELVREPILRVQVTVKDLSRRK